MKPISARAAGVAAGVLLAAAVIVAYLPVFRAGFVWDDDTFLTANPLIQAHDGLRRFWFSTQAPDYWPLTSSSLWFEWRLWGTWAPGYHVTNLLLHLTEAFLVWSILRRLALPGAYLAALLFAIHPVNVESVAWITQRKNLLAMLFYLASIFSFLKAGLAEPTPIRRSSENEGGRDDGFSRTSRFYWLSLAAFVLGMLSKGSVAFLPLVLLGLILWRRRPVWRDGLVLAPFFLAAACLVGVNLWFQGRQHPVQPAALIDRLLGAGAVVWFYLSKALVPVHLMFLYPAWKVSAGEWRWWLPLFGAVGLTALLWRYRHGWARPALFAWGYFCVALIPVMGFADITFMQFSPVADHYQHLALLGVTALAGVGWERWRSAAGARVPWAWATAVAVVAAQMAMTWERSRIYRDPPTLYRAILAANPSAWMAHNNLGLIFQQEGRNQEARGEFETTLQLNPSSAQAENNLGMLEAAAGHDAAAIARYQAALRLDPDLAAAHNNLGNEWRNAGRPQEAVAEFELALRYGMDRAGVHDNLGLALLSLGRNPEAIRQFQAALALDPGLTKAEANLGVAVAASGRLDEGIIHLQAALRREPGEAEAHYELGLALAHVGRLPEATAEFEQTVRLRPDHAAAQNNLGVALAQAGRTAEAISHFEAALKARPDYSEARENLSVLRQRAALPGTH